MAARSWNHTELMGNLTRDPELRYIPSGTAVCTFTIATNRTYVSEGERREEADFHRVVAWGKLAELCNQLLKKGNRVFVAGRLQNRSWETQEGQTRQTTEVVIEDMILLTARNGVSVEVDELPAVAKESEMPSPVEKEQSAEDEVPADEAPVTQKTDETVSDKDLPF